MAYTSFFRDSDALNAIVEIAIPELSRFGEIRVWDAGCATGEEPFTIAMIFAARMGPFSFRNLDILATDHEESSFPQFQERIANAMYSSKDVFWVPRDFRDVHFLPTDDPEQFCLTREIRDRVRYMKHDLLSYDAPETGKHLIVCKNVLMHFHPDQQVRVLEMYHHTLLEGGFLVLDGAQSIPAGCSGLFSREKPGYPLYRKRGP